MKYNNISVGKILQNNTFQFDNERTAIIGKNGSGKSTMLKVLAGIIIPDAGSFHSSKQDFSFPLSIRWRKYLKFVTRNCYYMASSSVLIDDFSIEQNFNYYKQLGRYQEFLFQELYEMLEINEPLEKEIKKLSDGTKQKLIVLFTLLSEKNVLIFDEPTNGFDIDCKRKFFNYINNLGKTVIVATHDIEYLSYFNSVYEVVGSNVEKVEVNAILERYSLNGEGTEDSIQIKEEM
jgi:ABC-type multidrug transport system ATPase subunit